MLHQPAPFPFAGSRAFLAGTAQPVTIVRRNADDTALVRIDPRPHHARNRDASGNREVPLSDLHETERAAFEAAMQAKPKRGRKSHK